MHGSIQHGGVTNVLVQTTNFYSDWFAIYQVQNFVRFPLEHPHICILSCGADLYTNGLWLGMSCMAGPAGSQAALSFRLSE